MTVLISLPDPKIIIMTADSRKTTNITHRDFELNPIGETTEFSSMNKIFPIPGIGCVSLWGEVTRAGIEFPTYLNKIRGQVQTIEDLRRLVENYLRFELMAELDGEDVGFHVGGFTPDGEPHLYHVFWGWDRPRPEGQLPDYRSYDSSEMLALYNGRNDFVDPIMKLLINLQAQVNIPIFDHNPVRRAILADFVTRYITQFTPDVGGEIHTVLINSKNAILHIRNPDAAPIPQTELNRILSEYNWN